jgi:hypothetical protein
MPKQTLELCGTRSITPTAGSIFSDGSILDLIRDQSCPTGLSLVFSDGRKISRGPQVKLKSGIYEPACLPESILRHLHFPAGVQDYGSTADLFNQLCDDLQTLGGMGAKDAALATYFAFSTFFADCLATMPCLIVASPDQGYARRCLRLLASVCRRALLLADLHPRGFDTLPTDLNPSLILDECSLSSRVKRFLFTSQHGAFGVLNSRCILDHRMAKAILVDEEGAEQLAGLSAARLYLTPPQSTLPTLDEQTLEHMADRFQPRLLQYRLKNYQAVRASTFDVPEFGEQMREVACTFGACVVGDSMLQQAIADLLRPQDQMLRGLRWTRMQSLVAEAILVRCHGKGSTVHVGELTKIINRILLARDENARATSRKVGETLRSFNFSLSRDARGYHFELSKEECSKIHKLGRELEIPTSRVGKADCEQCQKSRLN